MVVATQADADQTYWVQIAFLFCAHEGNYDFQNLEPYLS